MTKMTTKIATKYVERIEALNAQILDIAAEICQHYSVGDRNVIFDAVKERKAAMDAGDNASGLLASFDVVEE